MTGKEPEIDVVSCESNNQPPTTTTPLHFITNSVKMATSQLSTTNDECNISNPVSERKLLMETSTTNQSNAFLHVQNAATINNKASAVNRIHFDMPNRLSYHPSVSAVSDCVITNSELHNLSDVYTGLLSPNLRTVIKTEFNNASSSLSDALPLTLRISLLNLKLLTAASKQKLYTQEIQNFYALNSSRIESQRYQGIHSNEAWQHAGIHNYYDQQHHYLISRVEQWCHAIKSQQGTSIQLPDDAPSKYANHKPAKLSNTAVLIMDNWYNKNKEHPYPNKETTELLAESGKVSTEQVKKWFANKRLRTGNTKSLTEIARRRKMPLDNITECSTGIAKRLRNL